MQLATGDTDRRQAEQRGKPETEHAAEPECENCRGPEEHDSADQHGNEKHEAAHARAMLATRTASVTFA